MLVKLILACVSFVLCRSFSLDGELSITLSSTTIQESADYTITILLVINDPLTVDSTIQIYFPTDYSSVSSTVYPCDVGQWPLTVTALTCTMNGRTLVVEGGFPQEYEVTADTNFSLTVRGITNPTYAGTTGVFQGSIKNTLSAQIVGINTQTVTITTGSLGISLSLNPTTVNTVCDMVVSVTPSHSIPADGWIRLYFESNEWQRSSSVSPSLILEDTPSCHSDNNTPANLFCTNVSSSSWKIISIYNIVSASSSDQFSFIISSISSPPTTEPQGSFQFTTYTADSKAIDGSANHKISGLSPAQILNPSLTLTTYTVGREATATISLRITSLIETTDIIYIDTPSTIGLGSLSQIVANNIQITNYGITNTTIIYFSGISIQNSIQFDIVITSIINPGYVLTTDTFTIWTKRGNYEIDRIDDAFTYSTVSGALDASVVGDSYQAGIENTFTFAIQTEHELATDGLMEFVFPTQDFTILTTHSLTCSSNLSVSCSVTISQNNVVVVSNFVANIGHNRVSIGISMIDNPSTVGTFNSITISYQTVDGNVIDSEDGGIMFQVVGRQLSADDVEISSSVGTVSKATNINLLIHTNNPIPQHSTLLLTIPEEFTLTALSCTPYCTLHNGTTYQMSLEQTQTSTTIEIMLQNIRNPISTKPTSSFSIGIYNNNDILLQYITDGVVYQATELTSVGISLQRNSTTNKASSTKYTFTLGVTFTIGSSVGVEVTVPDGIGCSGCLVSDSNSSHYTILVEPLYFNASKKLQMQIDGFTNYESYEPQTIYIKVLAQNLIHEHAEGTITVTNDQPASLTYSYAFTVQQYQELTSMTIANLGPSVPQFHTLQLILGNEFTLTIAAMVQNPDYSSVILSNRITITHDTNTITPFTIADIFSPSVSPSSPIYISTYSESGYLMHEGSTFTWEILCDEPCKQCDADDHSLCTQCYDNELLVGGKVLEYNDTCVSICPDTYYHNTTTNSCLACSTACDTCVNFSQCISCSGSLPYLLNQTCYDTCPVGYYEYSGRCEECDSTRNCEECSDFVSCDSCVDGYYYYHAQCYSQCPQNITLENAFTNNCDDCPDNCTECNDGGCTVCENGYLLDEGGCYEECRTVGYVPYNDICRQCDESCMSCSGSIYNCLSCYPIPTTYSYFLTNKCLATCPDGYYEDDSLGLCLPCTQPCQYCTSSSVSTCTSCIDGFTLYSGTCESICPETFYQNASECVSCVSPCLTCTSDVICMSCVDGYVLFVSSCVETCQDGYVEVNKVCMECSSNCKTCESVNYCSSCFDGTYLFEGGCVQPCPDAYFPNTTALTCEECPLECSVCESLSKCLQCIGGYELKPAFQCESMCDDGYVPIDSICEQCSENCSACSYTTSNCTECVDGIYYASSLNKCYSTCPGSLNANPLSMQCVEDCGEGMYESGDVCYECAEFCSDCISATVCGGCLSGASIYEAMCYESCPAEAPYSVDAECLSCNILNCASCVGEECEECLGGYLLIGSTRCIDSCGEKETYNTEEKKCEAIPDNNNNNTTEPTYPNDNNTNNNTNNTNNTTTQPQTPVTLTFVPLPYLIVGLLITTIVIVVHFTHQIHIFPMLAGLIGILLLFTAYTVMIVETINNGFLVNRASYLLIGGIGVDILVNLVSVGLHCRFMSEKRATMLLIWIFGSKIYGFLCANLCGVNLRNQYPSFWRIYDKLMIPFIIRALAIITAGMLFTFDSEQSNYQFYGGIELVVLGVFDLLASIIWMLWKHTPQDFVSEKLFHPEDSFDHLEQHSQHIAGTEKINPKIEQTFSRDFKSENPRAKDVLTLKNNQIQEALDRGIYRRNKMSLANQQEKEDQFSELQSADKFNRVQKVIQEKRKQQQQQQNHPRRQKQQQEKISEEINEKQIQTINPIIFQDVQDESIDTEVQKTIIERKMSSNSLGTQKKDEQEEEFDDKKIIFEDIEEEEQNANTSVLETVVQKSDVSFEIKSRQNLIKVTPHRELLIEDIEDSFEKPSANFQKIKRSRPFSKKV